ncbi:MAG: hypothetical protein AB1414_09305 [bacterium]
MREKSVTVHRTDTETQRKKLKSIYETLNIPDFHQDKLLSRATLKLINKSGLTAEHWASRSDVFPCLHQ